MKEYIEKAAARDLMEQALADDWEIQYADDRFDEIPAADVVEVRHGRWMKHGYACPCSECGWDIGFSGTPLELLIKQFNYCPNCGAKMTEVN